MLNQTTNWHRDGSAGLNRFFTGDCDIRTVLAAVLGVQSRAEQETAARLCTVDVLLAHSTLFWLDAPRAGGEVPAELLRTLMWRHFEHADP